MPFMFRRMSRMRLRGSIETVMNRTIIVWLVLFAYWNVLATLTGQADEIGWHCRFAL